MLWRSRLKDQRLQNNYSYGKSSLIKTKMEFTKNGEKSFFTWALDESGLIIIMNNESGNKLYAIRDFGLTKKRIGFETSKGRFTDLLNLDSN